MTPTTNSPQRKFASVRFVAEYLSLTEGTIYTLLYEGKLPGCRVGRSWRIDLRALEQQLSQQVKEPR